MDRQAPVAESPAATHTKHNEITADREVKQVLVHFIIGHRREITLFRTDTPQDQLKDLFRSAAEAGARDILKLYNSSGLLMNINSSLPPNTLQNPYTLKVVVADAGGMLLEEVGLDVRSLEQRVAELEKQLRADHDQLPPAVHELKTQVDHIRNKLETTETLSWLGFYKQLPEPLSTEECQRLKYRRKSDSIRKKVKENFYNICDSAVTEAVREWLRLPTFDSTQWEDEELLLLLQYMFQDLDFLAKFAIDMSTLRNFLFEVYKNYNDVPFHNFQHCFCVAQMMYAIACYVDLPSKIGDLETLILLVSSICHDLDHPGYNNIYQINAKTELALRYNDISPLENHHCSVAFRILEMNDCNIFKSFTKEQFRQVREGMIRCILATDMARHNEILAQFKDITPNFDYSNKAHTNLLCMVLIKVADISNEARPMDVAEPWLDRLLQEFFKQSDAEKLEGLPVTPFMDRDKITKPSSQVSFIGFVLLPLFEALGELFTELQELIVQPVRYALDYYRRLNEQNKDERHHRKSVVAVLIDHPMPTGHQHHHHRSHSPEITRDGEKEILQQDKVTTNGLPKSGSNHSVRSRKAAFQINRSRSRSTEEESEITELNLSDDEHSLLDVAEDTESGDSETATEVEVSEKTLKFKISTEGNNTISAGRKSCPGSRKGSRERSQYLNCYEVARAVQGEKDRRKFIHGGLSFDQKTLMGKKLSFDTAELLDEQARRYFRQYKKVSIDSTSPDDLEKTDSLCNERSSSDSPNLEERRCSIVSPGSEESGLQSRSPNLEERRSSLMSSSKLEERSPRAIHFCTSPTTEDKKHCGILKMEDKKSPNLERHFFPKNGRSSPHFCTTKDKTLIPKSNLEERYQTSSSNIEVNRLYKTEDRRLSTKNGQEEFLISNKNDVSRPCDSFVNKQNNISAIMTDVCENSLKITDNKIDDNRSNKDEDEEEEEEDTNESKENHKINISKKQEKISETETISNSCKLDKISVDQSNKLVQGDTIDTIKTEEKPSPNSNRSLLARLKHFTDRLGFSIDKESNSKFMKHMKLHSLSFKNNNGRMTLPLRYRKKPENETCCKVEPPLDEQKRASTLPKLSKFTFGGKRNWKQRFLGKDRTSNSLDNIPPGSPLSIKASTSYSANNSRSTSPRKDLIEKERAQANSSKNDLVSAFEPDPQVLTTSIELM